MTQQTLFHVGVGGLETPTLPELLITRRDDPATSKRAARKVVRSGRIGKSLEKFLATLGDQWLTVRECADQTDRPDYWNHEWARRVHLWHVAGYIELIQGASSSGQVWRIAK